MVCALSLSWTIEILQALNPTRTSSLLDVATNILGACIGVAIALFIKHQSTKRSGIIRWFDNHCQNQNSLYLGVITLFIWMMAELGPFFPSFDNDILHHGVAPLTMVASAHNPLSWADLAYSTASLITLAVILKLTLKLKHPLLVFNVLVIVVLCLKIPVIGRQLHPEPIAALVCTNAILLYLNTRTQRRWFGLSITFVALLIDGLRPFQFDITTGKIFNWDMLRAQILHPLGLVDILKQMWLVFAACFFINHYQTTSLDKIRNWGALCVFAIFLVVEFAQTRILGRFPDITDAIIPVLAWYIAVLIPRYRLHPHTG